MLERISFPQSPTATTVTTARKKILIPTTVTTEAMIQFELYRELRARAIRCVLEFTAQRENGKHCRFDIAVTDSENYLAAIIECKNYVSENEFNTSTKQYAKYSEFGVPVFGCARYADIPGVVMRVSNLLNNEATDTDRLFEALKDLVNDEFRAWYCKAFWKLGGNKTLEIADMARKGRNPRSLFSYLLKQEMR